MPAPAALLEFLRFPSVSTDPARAADVRACAGWLADHLRRIGLPVVRVVRTPGHPVVYAEWCRAPGRPTVLVYGHYDVVPPDPLSAWRSPPFAPAVRGGRVYARGATDDKGQLFAHLLAVAGLLRSAGRLPVNVKFLIEGEEEIGSRHLHRFVARHRRRLAADAVLVSDTPMPAPDRPAVVYGLRGGLGLELTVTGPPRPLHAGQFGGAVANPAHGLARVLDSLHTSDGRVAVPGFYAKVQELSATARARLRRAGRSDADILAAAGVPAGWGEPGYTLAERTAIRPAIVTSGVVGGYTGPGGQAVVPARATAVIGIRLVPDQTPDAVERLVRAHVRRVSLTGLRVTVRRRSAAQPVVFDRRHPVYAVAAAALHDGFGRPPAFVRSGGTIPVVHTFQEQLGVPVVLMGFGLPADNPHGPNESFALDQLARAVRASTAFLTRLPAAFRRPSPRPALPAVRGERAG